MCKEASSPVDATVGINISLFAGFVGRNAIPFALAVPVVAVAILVVAHPLIVIACTVVAVVAATAGRVALSRWLLRVLGAHVVPVGLGKMNAREAATAAQKRRRRARVAIAAPARPAIDTRVPIAIGPPAKVIPGEVLDDQAAVVINGTRFPVLKG